MDGQSVHDRAEQLGYELRQCGTYYELHDRGAGPSLGGFADLEAVSRFLDAVEGKGPPILRVR